MSNLAIVILGFVFLAQLVSWVGKSVLQELVSPAVFLWSSHMSIGSKLRQSSVRSHDGTSVSWGRSKRSSLHLPARCAMSFGSPEV